MQLSLSDPFSPIRLRDILCFARNVPYVTLDGEKWSLRKALDKAYETLSDLSGYLDLTDSILHLIMHSPVNEDEEKEDIHSSPVNEDEVKEDIHVNEDEVNHNSPVNEDGLKEDVHNSPVNEDGGKKDTHKV